MVESSGHFWRNAAENGMKNNKSRLMAAFFHKKEPNQAVKHGGIGCAYKTISPPNKILG
jgi:hypothetical protein